MISLQRSMHSSQMYTPGPAISFLTCFWLLPQNEHLSRSPVSPTRGATGDTPFEKARALGAELVKSVARTDRGAMGPLDLARYPQLLRKSAVKRAGRAGRAGASCNRSGV